MSIGSAPFDSGEKSRLCGQCACNLSGGTDPKGELSAPSLLPVDILSRQAGGNTGIRALRICPPTVVA